VIAEEGRERAHLQIAAGTRAGREHLVGVVLAQFVAQPAADRDAEAALEAGEGFGGEHVGEGFLEQPLAAAAADPLVVGKRVGEIDDRVVE
jgi:hypothetical protein